MPMHHSKMERWSDIRNTTETCRSWFHTKKSLMAVWVENIACVINVINQVPFGPINIKFPSNEMFRGKN